MVLVTTVKTVSECDGRSNIGPLPALGSEEKRPTFAPDELRVVARALLTFRMERQRAQSQLPAAAEADAAPALPA